MTAETPELLTWGHKNARLGRDSLWKGLTLHSHRSQRYPGSENETCLCCIWPQKNGTQHILQKLHQAHYISRYKAGSESDAFLLLPFCIEVFDSASPTSTPDGHNESLHLHPLVPQQYREHPRVKGQQWLIQHGILLTSTVRSKTAEKLIYKHFLSLTKTVMKLDASSFTGRGMEADILRSNFSNPSATYIFT